MIGVKAEGILNLMLSLIKNFVVSCFETFLKM